MIRVQFAGGQHSLLEALGLHEIRHCPDQKSRCTDVFLAAPGDDAVSLELTYNWIPSFLHWRPFSLCPDRCRR
jgi:hypothetical protein